MKKLNARQSDFKIVRTLRWLLLLAAIICTTETAKAQKVVDYWYSNAAAVKGLIADSTGKAAVFVTAGGVTTSEGKTLTLPNPLGNMVVSSPKNVVASDLISPDISATHKGHHYFVWSLSHFLSDTFQFLDQQLIFNGHQSKYHLQIIETDLQFRVIGARRMHLGGSNPISVPKAYSVQFDANDRFTLFIEHFSEVSAEGHYEQITLKADSLVSAPKIEIDGGWYHLITFNKDLVAVDVLSFEDNEAPAWGRFGYHGYTNSSVPAPRHYIYDYSLFGFTHTLEAISMKSDGTNAFRINLFDADQNIRSADTFHSNLTNPTLESMKGKTAMMMTYHSFTTTKDTIYIQDTGWTQPLPAKSGLILCEIDEKNKIKVHHNFSGIDWHTFPSLNFQNDIIWLKVIASDTLWLNETLIIPTPGARVMYFAFDTLFNFIGRFEGVGAVDGLSTAGPPVIQNNTIHDVNYFSGSFLLDDRWIQQVVGNQILYTKLAISTSPIERPDFYYDSLSCSSARLYYRKTDAEFYAILVSNDSIGAFPKNGKNYNYSPDYLKSTPLGRRTRVLYQGPDTSVTITNLVAGRQYFFTVVPGNGPPYFTSYNTDSVKVLSLSIPPSTIQDSLWLTPAQDTGICQFDSLHFAGNGSFDLRWMDGSKDKERLLAKTESYSYRVTDTSGCLASSDTFTYTIYPNPELNSLKIVSDKPWCQGDTVQLQASAEHDLLWNTKETGQDIKVTTSGWYGVTATSDKNCTTTDSLEVQFNEAPIFQFSGDSLSLYADETELLPDFRTNAGSFQWIYSGDTSDSYIGFPPIDKAFLKVYALHQSGCYALDSQLTLVKPTVENALPNAFTPNGDGVNDVWKFYPSDSTGTLTVFDRWGEILLRDRTQQWDGVKQGQVLPDGVYFLMYEYEEGNEKKRLETPVFLMR